MNKSISLGILGGGQLGRYFVHAAQRMGYQVAVFDPDSSSPAGACANQHICTQYSDQNALQKFAKQCVAITTEFENIPAATLEFLAQHTQVAPKAHAVAIAQNRIREKTFFDECAQISRIYPTPWQAIYQDTHSVDEKLLPGILKTAQLGYDGKGQISVDTQTEFLAAQKKLQFVDCVLEQKLNLAYEVSVIMARGYDGQCVFYPIAQNRHHAGVLAITQSPCLKLSSEKKWTLQQATKTIAERLDYVGVLCVEYFVLTDGSILVNEMAPRPHNSGHHSIDSCNSSQFEQQVRALSNLPLAPIEQNTPAIMLNLLGDFWLKDQECVTIPWDKMLSITGMHQHLYGKTEVKIGRKMGHLTMTAPDQNLLRQRVVQLAEILETITTDYAHILANLLHEEMLQK